MRSWSHEISAGMKRWITPKRVMRQSRVIRPIMEDD
jgi:hypothetical protein